MFWVVSHGAGYRVKLILFSICVTHVYAWDPSRTKGEAWPLPKYVSTLRIVNTIDPTLFSFKITNETCEILEQAVKRYEEVIRMTASHSLHQSHLSPCLGQSLSQAEVKLTSTCESWPHLYMDEHYELHVNSPGYKGKAVIVSSSVWGVLRGLETFSQLIYLTSPSSCLMMNSTDILDYPRFQHRGLLLDTSRHYLPVSVLKTILSAMEMNKLNVFHWHIVDDQSFPYQSFSFPSLSEKGAYDSKKLIYTQEEVKNIIEFAKLRGIRVVPEFDSPGHTQSWGKGVVKLLTPCFTNDTFNGLYGPIDPTRDQNYKFLKLLLKEIKSVFQDDYIHIGGDEVDYTCWESNPTVNRFMKEKNISNYEGVEAYYIKAVLEMAQELNASSIVWQEVFQHNADLKPDTVVHIWTGNAPDLLYQVTNKGNFALLSAGWYLDHINDKWQDYYTVDPTDFNGTSAQKALVLGGEACMWGEMVDETNIVPRVWPRASAVAERLWSSRNLSHWQVAAPRLNEHVCRMRRRGVTAQPANGPGFCPY